MFTQPCFIRKISHELCDKLTELGYKDCWTGGIHTDELKTITYVGNQCWSLTGFKPRNSIDCGTNEELFLALSALRDDNDKNQYFICDKVSVTLGKTYYPGDYIYYQYDEFFDKQNWHKATLQELIEHFNKK